MTLKRYVATALFDVLLENSKRISISICKPRNYLDCITSKGKGPRIVDVSAMLALQTRVTLNSALYILVVGGFVRFGRGGII